MSILIVENSARAPAGRLATVIQEAGHPMTVVPAHEGVRAQVGAWDAVVVLGGAMGAYDTDKHPWLEDEMAFIRWALDENLPTLGICLGSQLIPHATSGRAFLAETPEVGFVPIELTPEGAADPVVGTLTGPVLAVHRDTFELPEGATELARSDLYVHAYRYRSALGIQFHPEADSAIVARWIAEDAINQMAEQTGTTVAEFADAVAAQDESSAAEAKRLFTAWLETEVL